MKAHLLAFIIMVTSFIAATFFLPGLNYGGDSETLVRSAVTFALLNIFIRPVIGILLMPLNFLTLGLMGGLTGLALLWLVTLLVPGFQITDSNFAGLMVAGQSIPSYQVNSLFTAIFGASLIGLISSILYWLTR
ncbi:MAG TPA: phage holin family protein [Patescibacteria group bacterium]|nr:phage holin family protein [Patescibacteria group bacterium]